MSIHSQPAGQTSAPTSNKGTFQVTKPSSLKTLDPGTTVRFTRIDGEPVETSKFGISSQWTTAGIEDVDAISTAVAGLISRHMSIPVDCVSLVWSVPRNQLVIVTIVLIPLSEELWGAYYRVELVPQPDWRGSRCAVFHEAVETPLCQSCFHPCHDADLDNTREANCVECHPCFLCDRCRITMRNGNPKCCLCLTTEDYPFIKEFYSDQIPRMRLLIPGLFA